MRLLTESDILNALNLVIDPDFNRGITELGFVQNLKIKNYESEISVAFDLVLTTPTCPVKDEFIIKCKQILSDIGVAKTDIKLSFSSGETASAKEEKQLPSLLKNVKKIIAIASGKGGVGKSTITANLAMAAALNGKSVGVLDADLYGPSMGLMFGITESPEINSDKTLNPIISHGVKVASAAMLFPPEQAIVWRGPRASAMIKNLLNFVHWDSLDYLFIDFPPGTGDIQLSIIQGCELSGAILVSTPQNVALADCIKGHSLFAETKVPVLGLIENMSYFICDKCEKEHYIFGQSGGKKLAETLKIPLLGQIPIETSTMQGAENGLPAVLSCPNSKSSAEFNKIIDTIVALPEG
ncbi:iron-sulfur cluster carrier protein [Fibrobacterales bacterium]|nr:iron-sulfur cluster carrier protein [Fibrobacterales bacterium]